MLSAHSTKGYRSCPLCIDGIHSEYRVGRNVICCHRMWLNDDHEWRYDATAFDGTQEFGVRPREWSGEEILEKSLEYDYGELSNHPDKVKEHTAKQKKMPLEYSSWTHTSIFFELPYWTTLRIRHNLDVIHIEKNVCDSIIGTCLDIAYKTKDNPRVREDLKKSEIRRDLWMKENKMPRAPYTISPRKKAVVLGLVASVRYPRGYAGNISRCVQVRDGKLHGLKTHDTHVLLQRVSSVIIRPFLDDRVVEPLIALSCFFQKLCAREISRTDVREMQTDIVYILCKLERIFPPAFFTTMIHLIIHLPDQVLLTGPVHFTWMYPTERQLGQYKGFGKNCNRANPEASIAEAYVAHECVTYCRLYLQPQNDNALDMSDAPEFDISVVSTCVKASGVLHKSFNLSRDEITEAHWCVLLHCTEAQYFMDRHKGQEVCHGDMVRHKMEFADYFQEWMRMPELQYNVSYSHLYSRELRILSSKPQGYRYLSLCSVNGIDYICESRNKCLRTQNSGVVAIAAGGGFIYGVLVAVIELLYANGMKMHLFKCRWFNSISREDTIKADHGLLSVNTSYNFYENEPFILATNAIQVFYIDDPKAGNGWKVVNKMSHRRIFSAATLGESNDEEDESVADHHRCVHDRVDEAYQEADTSDIPETSSIRVNNFEYGELIPALGDLTNPHEYESDIDDEVSESTEYDDSDDEDYVG